MFPGSLSHSLIGKALNEGIWSLEIIDLRDFSSNKWGSIDDKPFGGGPGMVIRPDVIEYAIQKTQENMEINLPLVYMTPVGETLVQNKLRKFTKGPGLTILCGRFEGVDERVLDAHKVEKISLGDYILPGGETAAMTVVEGCVRLLPGVVGREDSLNIESFNDNLLEYPHYTRPQVWIDANKVQHKVPNILLSGNHEEIKKWRGEKSLEITKKMRPDSLKKNK